MNYFALVLVNNEKMVLKIKAKSVHEAKKTLKRIYIFDKILEISDKRSDLNIKRLDEGRKIDMPLSCRMNYNPKRVI